MLLERFDEVVVEGRAAPCRPECPIAHVAAGPAGDLTEFGRRKTPVLHTIELPVGGEGYVIDIEIEAHADRIGRDDIINIAVLINLDLRIAGARRQSAENDCRAAALTADPFGNRIDLFDRKGDDGAAARKPRDLSAAGEAQFREPRPRQDRRAGQKLLDPALHGRGADQQGLLASAPVKQAIGEDVAAIEVGGELDFIDGDKAEVEVARHGLDRRDEIACRLRLDFLLAGDERDRRRADPFDDAVIDFPRQETQRQADDAARVPEHPLDRIMRLAGIGRPKHHAHAFGTFERMQFCG